MQTNYKSAIAEWELRNCSQCVSSQSKDNTCTAVAHINKNLETLGYLQYDTLRFLLGIPLGAKIPMGATFPAVCAQRSVASETTQPEEV